MSRPFIDREVVGWLPVLPVVDLPRLTCQMLCRGVLGRRLLRLFIVRALLLVVWMAEIGGSSRLCRFVGLARILSKVEDTGVWPEGLLDAYIAMIPETDGDATPLGQRRLGVLAVVYRIWASARMVQLDGWFRSWVPDSVFSAGGGRGSGEAQYTAALDIEEVLSGIVDVEVHLFVADVIKSFDTIDQGILDKVLGQLGFGMPILSTTLMLGCALSLPQALVSLGLVMEGFLRGAL